MHRSIEQERRLPRAAGSVVHAESGRREDGAAFGVEGERLGLGFGTGDELVEGDEFDGLGRDVGMTRPCQLGDSLAQLGVRRKTAVRDRGDDRNRGVDLLAAVGLLDNEPSEVGGV